jgi:putative DNA primase/helicase
MDIYHDVRLLILIGRTAPGPVAIEGITAALTGRLPATCSSELQRFDWFDRRDGAIQLRDGTAIKTVVDVHPDPVAEAVRWLINEAELRQAEGRGRGLNRTADCPLDLDLLVDTPLLPVDVVERWDPPSMLIKTAADDGVVLSSPIELTTRWPKIWPNKTAADRCLEQGVPKLPGFTEVAYQPKGPKLKRRIGWFDLARIPDPEAWLRSSPQNP